MPRLLAAFRSWDLHNLCSTRGNSRQLHALTACWWPSNSPEQTSSLGRVRSITCTLNAALGAAPRGKGDMILMPYTILNLKFLKCNTTDRGLTGDAFECHRTRAASPGLRREESGWTKMSSSSCSCSSRIVVVVVAAAVVVVAAWQHSSSSSSISSSGGAVQSCSHRNSLP